MRGVCVCVSMRWDRSWGALAPINQPQQKLFSRIAFIMNEVCHSSANSRATHIFTSFEWAVTWWRCFNLYFLFRCPCPCWWHLSVPQSRRYSADECQWNDMRITWRARQAKYTEAKGENSRKKKNGIDAYMCSSSGRIVSKIKHWRKRDRSEEGKERIQVNTEHDFLLTFLLVKISVLCCHKHRGRLIESPARRKGIYLYGLWSQRAGASVDDEKNMLSIIADAHPNETGRATEINAFESLLFSFTWRCEGGSGSCKLTNALVARINNRMTYEQNNFAKWNPPNARAIKWLH